MVRIRLQRFGRRHRPFYRIAAIDQRSPRDGRFLEHLGWYDPLVADRDRQVRLNTERARYWLGVGAQATDTVRDILARFDLIDRAAWERRRAARRSLSEARRAAEAAEASAEPAPGQS